MGGVGCTSLKEVPSIRFNTMLIPVDIHFALYSVKSQNYPPPLPPRVGDK